MTAAAALKATVEVHISDLNDDQLRFEHLIRLKRGDVPREVAAIEAEFHRRGVDPESITMWDDDFADEEEEDDGDLGPWCEMSEAPLDGSPVDLWIDMPAAFGKRLPDCFWNAQATPAYWHQRREDGAAASINILDMVSYWMPAAGKDAIVRDVPASRRHYFDDGMIETWPEELLQRVATFLADDTDEFGADLARRSAAELRERASRSN
ncbi:hypothetical protein FHS96_005828 [Sphingomonas zeicaulis]|uniref:hypothetical protein n=1 Tax=Sphingomonas zeicaulis TaxID=1632740 RepID=UPI003D1C9521